MSHVEGGGTGGSLMKEELQLDKLLTFLRTVLIGRMYKQSVWRKLRRVRNLEEITNNSRQ